MQNLFQNVAFSPLFNFEGSCYKSEFEVYYDAIRSLNIDKKCWSIPTVRSKFNELKSDLAGMNTRQRTEYIVNNVLNEYFPNQIKFDSVVKLNFATNLVNFLVLEFFSDTIAENNKSSSCTRLSLLKDLNELPLTKQETTIIENKFTSELHNQKSKKMMQKYMLEIQATEDVYDNFVPNGRLDNLKIRTIIDYQIANSLLTTPTAYNPFIRRKVRECNLRFLKHFRLKELNHFAQVPVISNLLQYTAERMSCVNLFLKFSSIISQDMFMKDYFQILANLLAMHPLVQYRLKLFNLISPSTLSEMEKQELKKYRIPFLQNSLFIDNSIFIKNINIPGLHSLPFSYLVQTLLQQVCVIIPICSYLLKLYEKISPQSYINKYTDITHEKLSLFDKEGQPSNIIANTENRIVDLNEAFKVYLKSISKTTQTNIMGRIISQDVCFNETNMCVFDEFKICQILWEIDYFNKILPDYYILLRIDTIQPNEFLENLILKI